MAELNISARANGVTLEPCKHGNTAWIEIRDGNGELLNIAIFIPAGLAERVDAACRAFNSEMDQ